MKLSYYSRNLLINSIFFLLIGVSVIFYAFSTGITGRTLKPGGDPGCTCHASDPSPAVTVSITGPDSILANQQVTYTVTISGGTLIRGGTNIAASNGVLAPVTSDLQLMDGELTHVSPKEPVSGTVTFQFNYTSPAALGNQTLFANGNSVNFNGNNGGDQWNFAPSKTVKIVLSVPVELTSFTALSRDRNVYLNWRTSTETNNKGFYLERLNLNKMAWERIGFVEGKGNSTAQNDYFFKDINLAPGNYQYRLKQVDYNGSLQYHNLAGDVIVNSPSDFVMDQNYPNPFNPSTTIRFSVASEGNVVIKLYNAIGVETGVLMNEYKYPGSYVFNYNAENLSSGIYYYKMDVTLNDGTSIYSNSKKMILLK